MKLIKASLKFRGRMGGDFWADFESGRGRDAGIATDRPRNFKEHAKILNKSKKSLGNSLDSIR